MEGFTIVGIVLFLLAAVWIVAHKEKKPISKNTNTQPEYKEVVESKPVVKRVYKKKKEISGSQTTSSSTEGGTES